MPPRAYIFLGLNAVRFLSLVALILVFASSIVQLVNDIKAVNAFVAAGKEDAANSTFSSDDAYIINSTVPNQPAGAFWAVTNRLLIIFQVMFLFVSEIGLFSKFFDTYFPVLGSDFGLGALGVFECLLGAAILSHKVQTFALVSAFFLFSIGCLNILAGLIFRESAKSKRALLSWREREKSVLPDLKGKGILPMYTGKSDVPSFLNTVWTGDEKSYKSNISDHKRNMSSESGHGPVSLGFGRQGEKAAAQKGYLLTRPIESTPPYVTRPIAKTSPEMRGSSLSGKTAVNPGQYY